MAVDQFMTIQVCYPSVAEMIMIDVQVPLKCNVQEAIQFSGILLRSSEIDLEKQKVGVFGKLKALDAPLYPNDRVEIYRPLLADPMEARRRRALKQKKLLS